MTKKSHTKPGAPSAKKSHTKPGAPSAKKSQTKPGALSAKKSHTKPGAGTAKKSHTKPGAPSARKAHTKPVKRPASTRKPVAQPGSGRVQIVIVPKPWGHETIWARSDRYVGKILHINAGQELSVQYHEKKDETVYLLSGQVSYRVQGESDLLEDVQLKPGESFRMTAGTVHQIVGLTDCDVLEVSTPELDDVVRLSDKYGREGTSAP